MSESTPGGGLTSADLVKVERVRATYNMTPEEINILKRTVALGASDAELQFFLLAAKSFNLNPFRREIHFVKRRTQRDGKWIETFTMQTAIDGLRKIAVATKEYDGQDEPEFETDANGQITLCRVRVYRKGISRPFVGVAYFNEYAQTSGFGEDRKLNPMWREKPHIMIAKCAEALALRKAFPGELSQLYAEDELPTTPQVVEALPEVVEPEPIDLEIGKAAEELGWSKAKVQLEIENAPDKQTLLQGMLDLVRAAENQRKREAKAARKAVEKAVEAVTQPEQLDGQESLL